MFHMFENASGLERLDVSSFNTSKETNMEKIFANMPNINSIYVGSNWTTANAKTTDMFLNSKTNTLTNK